jgi:hypothetical protein
LITRPWWLQCPNDILLNSYHNYDYYILYNEKHYNDLGWISYNNDDHQ